jgi:hypothetical protein
VETIRAAFERHVETLDQGRTGIIDASGSDGQELLDVMTESVSSPGDLTGISIGTSILIQRFERQGITDVRWEPRDLSDRAAVDILPVVVGRIGELPEFLGEEREEGVPFVFWPVEVLRREGIQRELFDAEFLTPAQDLFGGLGAFAVSIRSFLAALSRVPAVAVLDDGDMGGGPEDTPLEVAFVGGLERIAETGEHYVG